VKPFIYNALAAVAATVLVVFASAMILSLVFLGSALRMSNVTQLGVFTAENLSNTLPLFVFVVVAMLIGFFFGFDKHTRKKG
jgi:hypothetical protein